MLNTERDDMQEFKWYIVRSDVNSKQLQFMATGHSFNRQMVRMAPAFVCIQDKSPTFALPT